MEPLGITESFSNKIGKSFAVLKQKKNTILKAIITGLLLGLAVYFLQPKLFKAVSVIIFKYDSFNNPSLALNGSLENEINYILSDQTISTVKKFLHLNYEVKNNIEAVEDLTTSSILIKVTANNSKDCASIANGLVEIFLSKAIINNRGSYLTLIKEIEKREKENTEDILRNTKNFQEFISNASIKNLNPKETVTVNHISDLESDLEIIEYDNKLNRIIYDNLIGYLGKNYPEIHFKSSIINNNKKIEDIENTYKRALTEKYIYNSIKKIKSIHPNFNWKKSYYKINTDSLGSLLKTYVTQYMETKSDSKSFKFNMLKNLIWKIEETKAKLDAIDLSKSMLYDIITSMEDKFNSIPVRYLEIAQLERRKKFNLKLDRKLKIKSNELKKKAVKYFAEIDSITQAEPPQSFYSPNLFNNLFVGGLLGLLFGIGFALFTKKSELEFITSVDDFEDSQLQIISQIPTFPHGQPILINFKKLENENLKNAFESIEAYLKYGNLDKVLKTVLITSFNDNEGKSIIASNLAILLANNGAKVLLVDLNFINPKLSKLFEVNPFPFLAHFLLRKKEVDDIIKKSKIENLNIITETEVTKHLSSIVNSHRLKDFIKIVSNKYDFVILDTASLTALNEIITISQIVDQTIIVARSNQTQQSDVSEITSLFEQNNINNYSIVLNDVE